MWELRKRKRKNRRKTETVRRRQLRLARLARGARILGGLAAIPVLGLALIFGHDLMTQCDLLRIARVDVLGNARIDAETVRRQAQVAPGMNLLKVNLKQVRQRLLAHPWVADAAVRREFPDHLRIWVQEQHPLAVLAMDRPLLVNTAGRVFKVAQGDESEELARITGVGYGDLPVGQTGASPALAAALTVLRADGNRPSTPAGRIARIGIDSETGLTVWTDALAGPVVLGYGEFDQKFSRLSRILVHFKNRFPGEGLERIDLTDIHRIVVAPVSGEPAAADQKEV